MSVDTKSMMQKLTFAMVTKILIKGLENVLHFMIIREISPESYGKFSLIGYMVNFHRYIAYNCIRPAALKRAETLESKTLIQSSHNLV
jgi:hypothetical protein